MNLYKWPRSAAGLVALVLSTPFLASCGGQSSSADSEDTATIGVVISTSGPLAGYGKAVQEGMEIFAKAQAADPEGALGAPVEFVFTNDNSEPTATVAAVQELVQDTSVDALFGGIVSGLAQASMPVIENAKIPTYFGTPNPYADKTNLPYMYQLPTGGPVEELGVLKSYLKQQKVDIADVAVAYSNDESGQLSSKLARGEGFTNVKQFPPSLKDYAPYIAELKAKDVKLIEVAATSSSAVDIRKAQLEANFDVPIIVSATGFNGSLAKALGNDMNGMLVSSFAPGVDPSTLPAGPLKDRVSQIREAYKKFGGNMNSITQGAIGWDAAMSFALAVEEAGGPGASREAINTAMQSLSYDSVFGPIKRSTSDHKGLTESAFLLTEYKDGTLSLLPAE